MTKERIAQLKQAWKHAQDELGRQYSWVTAGKECLDEIERLEKELESLKTEKRHLVNAAVKAIEDCRKRDLLYIGA